MREKLTYLFIGLAIVCFSFTIYGKSQDQNPPPPSAVGAEHGNGNGNKPCGKGNGGGNGPNIPPPVGLCLPINDYILPLFIAGILFGAYKINALERLNQEKSAKI
jgi:hypothetical protein